MKFSKKIVKAKLISSLNRIVTFNEVFKINKKNLHLYLFAAILIVGIFFRFYNTPDRYTLSEDSTRDAMVALEGARQLQLPLVGPFSSLGQFTFGPWYYFQLIIFNIIVPFEYSSWLYLGITSTLFIIIIYKIGDITGGKKLGLVASLLVAISPPQISTATFLTNPSLVSFFAGLSILLFLIIIDRPTRSSWWSFLLGISLGIGINVHYQMAGLILLLVLVIINIRNKRLFHILALLSGMFLTFLPLLFFDLNNHWYTLKHMVSYYIFGKNAMYVPNRWLFYLRDFWPSFWAYSLGVSIIFGGLIAAASLTAIIFVYIRRDLNKKLLNLFIIFIFNFILLRYYWGERSFTYLQFLYPLIFIFSSYTLLIALKIKHGKYIFSILLLILVTLILPVSVRELRPDGLKVVVDPYVSQIIQNYPYKQISLYNCKDSYYIRAKAVAVLLAMKKKIGEKSDVKIGFYHNDCLSLNIDKHFSKIGDTDAYDLSKATEDELSKAGWIMVAPNLIYNDVTRWWFDEKP